MSSRPPLSRRRALRILAAGVSIPLGVLALRRVRGQPQPVQWHGEALGAVAHMTLWHPDPGVAKRAMLRMQAEIARLEAVFSLHRPESELSRLNRDGRIGTPSRDLFDVFDQSRRIAEASGGAFDPTIQPLWRLYAETARSGAAPDPARLAAALRAVDHTRVSASRRAIRFDRPGMSASLNGIAQGYVTDRITDLLGNEGFENAVIELGETRALGHAPDGTAFTIGLVDPLQPHRTSRSVALADASLSVSGGYGLRFGDASRHHIFDPKTGISANRLAQVAVIAPRATLADGLSTAIYVAGESAAPALLAGHASTRAILTRADGTVLQL
ncbi:FAD:protein FMN transferase [Sinisalibacter lacisalsi]|uniref:FAD:protein FMN transferase n=1 Tax=Sinisalibacter lacisalsi TaxID=1526570 RepID=A0ABQ1QTA6_9RHOB|nr:FAD:protein FMN transferase [Sinisalibacter lacisalsi]GGD41848.1 FAD:protein FMN transferase [Sinisalibacter lacisalsi]